MTATSARDPATRDVFISYARSSSRTEAVALRDELGGATGLAFLDTEQIGYGDHFPARILDALYQARVVVILADARYFQSWYCLFEYRVALAPWSSRDAGVDDPSLLDHVVVAIPSTAFRDEDAWHLPPALRVKNWPVADGPAAVADEIRGRLRVDRPTVGELIDRSAGIDRMRAELLDLAGRPPPQPAPAGWLQVPPFGLPPSLGDGFVGRSDELWQIDTALSISTSGAAPVVAIEGLAGVGKSRLAAEYVHRLGPRRHPGGCLWIDAGQPLLPQWHDILRAVDPATSDLAAVEAGPGGIKTRLASALRARDLGRRPLVVVDNVPDIGENGRLVRPDDLCPVTGLLPMLITSRVRMSLRSAGAIRGVAVETLDEPAAIALLRHGVPDTMLDGGDLTEVVNHFGRLPLALTPLNALLVHRACTARQLAERAATNETTPVLDRAMDALRDVIPEGQLRGATEALFLSYEALPDHARTAARLLSWLAPAPIPETLVEAFGDHRLGDATRGVLVARSFVTASNSADVFGTMHVVLADYLHTTGDDSVERELVEVAQALINVLTPERVGTPREWPVVRACEPHAIAMFERFRSLQSHRQACELLGAVLCFGFLNQTRYADSATIGMATLFAFATDGHVSVTPELHMLLERLPEALAQDDQLDVAIDWQRINGDFLARDPTAVEGRPLLASRSNLANMLRARGTPEDLDEAEAIYAASIPSWRSIDPRSADTAKAINNLGLVLLGRERRDEAAPLLDEALELIAGRSDMGVERVVGTVSLAIALEHSDPGRSRRLVETALADAAQIGLPDGHVTVQIALRRSAMSARREGDHAGAAGILGRALRGALDLRPPTDSIVSVTAWDLYEAQLAADADAAADETRRAYLDWLITADDDNLDGEQRTVRAALQQRSSSSPS